MAPTPSPARISLGDEPILASYGRRTWLPLAVVLIVAGATSFVFFPWVGVAFLLALVFLLVFFRDPERRSSAPEGALLAPADGKIVEIARGQEPDHIAGATAKVAIFMSLTDVHVNRSPCKATVEWVRHAPGRFHSALRPQASVENEMAIIALRDDEERPLLLKLIAGVVARRIACPLRPGDALERGQRIGMIKFGSRVEVFVPDDGKFQFTAKLGQHVRAGETIVGVWR